MKTTVDRIITDIAHLCTLAGPREPRSGAAMSEIGLVEDAAIAIAQGRVVAAGKAGPIADRYEAPDVVSAGFRLVTPGLLDCHTHLVFGPETARSDEFCRRASGESYEAIAREGGGIRATVRHTRKATLGDLVRWGRTRVRRMLLQGTTSAEAKSGYGLDHETELRQLRAIEAIDRTTPVDLVPTFLGAHEVPDEYRADRAAYIRLLIEDLIPAAKPYARFFDIFCEEGVFSIEESRLLLQAARAKGFALKLHADELSATGGAELAAEMRAVSADHLCRISDTGISALAASGTVAVLLPGTTFFLGKNTWAPARRMIEAGVAVALATDFNPGSSPVDGLPLILTLAVLHLKLTPAEALTAVTHNAAHAMGLADTAGRLEPQMPADIVVWDVPTLQDLVAHAGSPLTRTVYKRGDPVVNRFSDLVI